MKQFFMPGLRIKRWLLMIAVGAMLFAVSLLLAFGEEFNTIFNVLSAQITAFFSLSPSKWNMKLAIEVVLFIAALVLVVLGLRELFSSLVDLFIPEKKGKIFSLLSSKASLKTAPNVVVIGGGTGLYTLLKGLKKFTHNITAVVSVSDAGGSSGKLRAEFGMLPPGDIRMCLVALSDQGPLMARLLQYRFKEGKGLKGHSFGNLLITALSKITGSFDRAVMETGEILAIRGRVLPVTLKQTTLCAELENGKIIKGEPVVESSKKKYNSEIKKIFLEPRNTIASDETLRAIRKADLIVLGPGSLYTSIIPNLVVKGIPSAIKQSKAKKVYISNVMTQPGETDNYTASDHVRKVVQYLGKDVLDYVVVNKEKAPENLYQKYREKGANRVSLDEEELEKFNIELVKANLMTKQNLLRHDSVKLAKTILRLS